MRYRIYQVDAFTEKLFAGNPAAVCPLDEWISDEIMKKIASENNLADTAFYVKSGNGYEIRWFTPAVEVDLCGHATLAASFVLFNYENHKGNEILLNSHRSGTLSVTKNNGGLTLNFPADTIKQTGITESILKCFDIKPVEAYKGKSDYLLLFENEEQIKNIKPDFRLISELDARGVIITAKGTKSDFVSRFFGPQCGIDEDPVTGSAHTTLTPYWSEKLGRNELTAIQMSKRTGYLKCRYLKERVEIIGKCKLYMKGEIYTE